ncbi:RTA1-domain-containing protein [Jaminaea rosea]|uniref:RTA1-domain-containing protein n=1 Tax=Jaminaea rosea TaxID=1569628 RepID=A0A316UYZ5_9BASI|nr:RTA1-domain-containing protein [Jaminaea rosea]PWN30520.1 RTA1-domain-containing protein [Jaminaea rosea]
MSSRRVGTFFLATLCLLLLSQPAAAATTLQPDSILQYVPSLPGNAIVTAFYGFFSLVLFIYVFRTRSWWALCEPIGAFFSFLGYLLRIVMRSNQSSQTIYIVLYLFVVLSPACYLAFNYIIYGRLLVALTGIDRHDDSVKKSKVKSPYSPLPPRLYTAIFVISDVVTFLIQAAGGGMQTSNGPIVITGNHVFLAGVVLQMASYVFFSFLMLFAHFRLARDDPAHFSPLKATTKMRQSPGLVLLYLLYVSSIAIIVRLIYRTVEMAQGYGGQLYSNEIYTFLLDAMPLLISIGVWAAVWPGTLLERVQPTEAALRGRSGAEHNAESLTTTADAGTHEKA